MHTDLVFKNFSDIQVYSLNNNRVAPNKKYDSYGADNDKIWKCEISFADKDGIQRVMNGTASKKDLAEALAVVKVANFFKEEKAVKVQPKELRKLAILKSIEQKLDLILQIVDPQGLIQSHLIQSGDVEQNPGPSYSASSNMTIQNTHAIDLDPMYPEDCDDLDEVLWNISNVENPSLETIRDLVCSLTYYQTYFALSDDYSKRIEFAHQTLGILASRIHLDYNYQGRKLMLSGDVEMNPGPAKNIKSKEAKEIKTIEKRVKKIDKKLRVPLKNPVARTRRNMINSFNRSNSRANRVRSNIDNNYVKAVEVVTLPSIDNDFRWPSQFTAEKTGVANVFERPDVGFAKTLAATPDSPFPATDGYAVLQKIPECASIVFDMNPGQTPWEYEFSFKGGGNLSNNPTYATTGLIQLDATGDFTPLKLIQGTVTTTYAPHTNHVYAAQHSDIPFLRFIWMNKHDIFSAVVTNNAGTNTTFSWKALLADADGEPNENDLGSSAAILPGLTWSPTFTCGKDGYYAFVFSASQTLNATFAQVKLTGEGYVFCHRAMPSFDTNIAKIDSNRILGASIMITENASVTNMQGKIRIAQVPKDRNWYDFVGKFDEFSGLKGSEKFEAINGCYGFIKPTSNADFEFRSFHSTNGNTITDSFWPIKLDSAATTEKIILYVRITNQEGQDMYWTFAYALEYRSNDQFVSLDVSSIDTAAANRALEVIKNMQQFHENPLHLSDIVKTMKMGLKKAIGFGVRAYPVVSKAVKDYGPTALKAATALASVL